MNPIPKATTFPLSISAPRSMSRSMSSPPPVLNITKERTEMKSTMKQRNSQFQSSLAGVCSVLLVLCAGQPGLAQQDASAQSAASVQAVTAAATQSAARPDATLAGQENETPAAQGGSGIKVHGHWKFVVHNADGTLASTKEFENSLITPAAGDFLIASALIGQSVVVDWAVMLCPVAGTDWATPPYFTGRMLTGMFCPGTNLPVGILVPSFTTIAGSIVSYSNFCNNVGPGTPCLTGMTQALTGGTTSSPAYSITLNGNFTALTNVTINAVGTYTGYCPPLGGGAFATSSAATCETTIAPRFSTNATPQSPTMLPFTGTNQSQSLIAGQILTITVTISFS
jgi:hypothetical protein